MRLEPIMPKGKWPLDLPVLLNGLARAMSDTVKSGQRKMQTYPPQLASLGPRYRRTGTLRRSWSSNVQVTGERIEGIVGSNSGIAPYNRLVQGKEQQPWHDAAGWPDVHDLIVTAEKELPPRLQRAVKAAVVRKA